MAGISRRQRKVFHANGWPEPSVEFGEHAELAVGFVAEPDVAGIDTILVGLKPEDNIGRGQRGGGDHVRERPDARPHRDLAAADEDRVMSLLVHPDRQPGLGAVPGVGPCPDPMHSRFGCRGA